MPIEIANPGLRCRTLSAFFRRAGRFEGARSRYLNVFRNPVVGSGDAQVINNLIYRPGRWGGHKGLVRARETATRASIVGNVYILSPVTTSSQGLRVSSGSQAITLFLHDNVVFRPQADNGRGAWFPTNANDWSKETVELQNRRLEDVHLDADPFTAVGIPVLPSCFVTA